MSYGSLTLALVIFYLSFAKSLYGIIINAHFDEIYTGKVNETMSYRYIYTYSELKNTTQVVRFNMKSTQAGRDYPVQLVIRQQRTVQSYQIPIILQSLFPYQFMSRTLCPVESNLKDTTKTQRIYVDVSCDIPAPSGLEFTFQAYWLTTFNLEMNEDHVINIAPPQPQYFQFTFPPGVDSVDVHVNSDSKNCMIFSIQSTHCPVYDLVMNVEYSGTYQTISAKGSITAERSNYNLGSFFVVLIVKPDDEGCSQFVQLAPIPGISESRSKNVTIRVEQTISLYEYVIPVLSAISFFALFYVAAFVLIFVYHCCERNITIEISVKADEGTGLFGDSPGSGYGAIDDATSPSSHFGDNFTSPAVGKRPSSRYCQNCKSHLKNNTQQQQPQQGSSSSSPPAVDSSTNSVNDMSSEDEDVDMLLDAQTDPNIVFMNKALYVSDLSRKKSHSLTKKYQMYHWYIIIIAIFYGLPVIQLVITYQRVFRETGNQDTCYYNFYCARPWLAMVTFNNIFSNIGYVLLGLLFFILTLRRAILHRSKCASSKAYEQNYGIPQHFGLFYAMGIALTMEGLMSACYHVCPNYTNFQFDTAFMYILAGLTMLKIYQIRHPDINASAHTAYMLMAVVILVGVVGVVYVSVVFWIVFTVVFLLLSVYLTTEVYYLGHWSFDLSLPRRLYHALRNDGLHYLQPRSPARFVLLLFTNVVNVSLAIYGVLNQPADFPSFLLAIFMVNLFIYFTFYIIMKLRHKERFLIFPLLYILLATVSWALALYFFFQHSNSWELSPAQSRALNSKCVLFDFFDVHDIWHFLSSLSLFFSFMILLHLDDDLLDTPRSRIPVF